MRITSARDASGEWQARSRSDAALESHVRADVVLRWQARTERDQLLKVGLDELQHTDTLNLGLMGNSKKTKLRRHHEVEAKLRLQSR